MEANPWAAFQVSRLACWMKKAEAHMPFARPVAALLAVAVAFAQRCAQRKDLKGRICHG
jgi:hypothetical protein